MESEEREERSLMGIVSIGTGRITNLLGYICNICLSSYTHLTILEYERQIEK